MIKAIERATGTEFAAKVIDGGYEVFTLTGEKYKKLKDSTFKRYFKVIADEVEEKTTEDEDFEDEPTDKVEDPKPQPEPETHKNTEKKEKSKSKPEPKTEEKSEPITADKRKQMIDKVKKLLALSDNNPSQEEAISAALMAHKLMAKYNIHEDDVSLEEIKDEIDSLRTDQAHDSHLMGWRKPLAMCVSKAFRCKCYMRGQDVVFRGYKDDAKLALDVYLMLYAVGHKLAKQTESKARTMKGSAKGVYNTFAMGFVKGVNDALNEQCTALLVITPKAVEDDWTQFSAKFTKGRKVNTKIIDRGIYDTGYTEGKAAVKARSIEKKGGK